MTKLKLEIPEEFYKEEVRDGYRISHEMKKLWAVELDLLAELKRVCDLIGVSFHAWGGTLLGVMRHKGFVPWDNDIDLSMFRNDYEKFCKEAPKYFKAPYFLQTEYTDRGSLRGHAQLRNSDTTMILTNEIGDRFKFNQGVFLDIFPLDVFPSKGEAREKMQKELAELKKQYKDFAEKEGRDKENPYYGKFEECASQYSDKISTEANEDYRLGEIVVSGIVDTNNGLSFDVYKEITPMPFEWTTLNVPCGYEDILEMCYGSWKEFVIGNNQHGDVFVDVDTCYKTFLNPDNMEECQRLYDWEREYRWRGDKEWQLKEHWRQLAELWQLMDQKEEALEALRQENRELREIIESVREKTDILREKSNELRDNVDSIDNYGILRLWKKLIKLRKH